MSKTQPGRQNRSNSSLSRWVLSSVRILIASYFLATATGLVLEPSNRMLFDAILNTEASQLASTIYLFVTAFAIMVGVALRPAALLLAVYIFWSGFVHHGLGTDAVALSAYWRDMALLGAILLIAITEPGATFRLRVLRKHITPRRVAMQRRNRIMANRQQSQPQPEARTAAFADKTDNIFCDAWDAKQTSLSAA